MKLLVILSRIPYPLDKGDKLRAYHQLKELSARHEIILCCLHDRDPHPDADKMLRSISSEYHLFKLRKWRIAMNFLFGWFSNKPFQVLYFYQRPIHRAIRKLIARTEPDHIFCQLIRTAEYAKQEFDYRKTIDFQDAFGKGLDRRYRLSKGLRRAIFRMERDRVVAYENVIFEYFDHKTIISEEDRRYIIHPNREDIHVIPNGIDTEFFKPNESVQREYDLVFVGNMSYAPNVETACYIAEEILPEIHKTTPGTTLLIAGADPIRRVRSLAENPKITLLANPKDIRGAYLSGKVFIAPMQLGTGLQNKLLEAMSLSLPCITSELANKALRAREDEVIFIGKTPSEYARHAVTLLGDPNLREAMGAKGREYVKGHFSWSVSTSRLGEILGSLTP